MLVGHHNTQNDSASGPVSAIAPSTSIPTSGHYEGIKMLFEGVIMPPVGDIMPRIAL